MLNKRNIIIFSIVFLLIIGLVAGILIHTNNQHPSSDAHADRIVYITRTGSKYHMDFCRYLSKSKIAIPISKAKEDGYTACSVCDPGD
jgi:hypothetical protein